MDIESGRPRPERALILSRLFCQVPPTREGGQIRRTKRKTTGNDNISAVFGPPTQPPGRYATELVLEGRVCITIASAAARHRPAAPVASSQAVAGEPMQSTTAPKVIRRPAVLIVTSSPDDSSPSIPTGARTQQAVTKLPSIRAVGANRRAAGRSSMQVHVIHVDTKQKG
jgi:hypothetical protein